MFKSAVGYLISRICRCLYDCLVTKVDISILDICATIYIEMILIYGVASFRSILWGNLAIDCSLNDKSMYVYSTKYYITIVHNC